MMPSTSFRGTLEESKILTHYAVTSCTPSLQLLPGEAAAAPPKLQLLLRLANALGLSGRLEASLDTLTDALPLIPADWLGLRARVITSAATLERLLGRYPQARAALRSELASLPQLKGTEAADLLFELAGSARLDGDFTEAHRWALQAVTATRDHDTPLYAAALSLLARTTASHGDAQRATALLAEAGAVLDDLPDAALTARLETTAWVGWAELLFDRYGDAARHFARGLALAKRTGQNHVTARLLVGQATVHGTVGRLDEASEVAAAAADAAELTASRELLAAAMAMRCWFATWTEDIALAHQAGQRAVEEARAVTGTALVLVLAQAMLAHVYLMDGNPARCVSDLLRAAGGAGLPDACPLTRAAWYEILVRAELVQGNRTKAVEWADRAEAAAATVGVPGQIAVAQLARAEVLLAEGAVAASAERAGAAATAFTELGDLLHAGQARLLAGRALTEAGERDDAARELEGARVLFAKMGVSRLHAETVRRLRGLGRRVPSPRGDSPVLAGLPSLTAREREVASLVARGYSNRQIAAELVLSVRTVTTHISHIFAKLGVSSRAAIAAAWAHSPSRAAPGARDA